MRQRLKDSSVDKEGNVTFSNERYASLSTELIARGCKTLSEIALTSLSGTYPTDIDDFNARFNPTAVLDKHLADEGITKAEIEALSPAVHKAFDLFMLLVIDAIIFIHGKPPGMPDEDAHRQEPIT